MATKKPVKRTTSKAKSSKKQQPMRSFRVAKSPLPFNTFRFTKQTVYWIIILAIIVILQLWIIKLELDIADLTSQIEM